MRYSMISALLALLLACCHSHSECTGRDLTAFEVRSRVEQYLAERGEGLPRDRKAEVVVKRQGCGYIYVERGLPLAPGEHLVARVDRSGKVVELLRGR